MNMYDREYIKLINKIMIYGTNKGDRTGVGTRSITGTMIKHNMSDGFPILTTKRVGFKTAATELEGFLIGNTSKKWLQDHNCNIWNEWCRPDHIPEDLNESGRKAFQLYHDDLGPIYGAQWNKKDNIGVSQLDFVLRELEYNPNSRRMLVSAWNHNDRRKMALEPCHVSWQVVVNDCCLDLVFYMRSVDVFLGMPFDMIVFGLLLSLLAKQFNLIPGTLTGFFADTHIYNNHFNQVQELASRHDKIKPLPTLLIHPTFNSIKEFNAKRDVELLYYIHEPAIKGDIAI